MDVILILLGKNKITTYYEISYFGFNFNRKSTYNIAEWFSAVGLFCCDKFGETPNEKVSNMSKLTKYYFNFWATSTFMHKSLEFDFCRMSSRCFYSMSGYKGSQLFGTKHSWSIWCSVDSSEIFLEKQRNYGNDSEKTQGAIHKLRQY